MNNLTISVFGNQIFSEVLNEIKLLTKWTLEDNQLYAYGYDKSLYILYIY